MKSLLSILFLKLNKIINDMGLKIKNNITISGTQIELPEIYGRIEFAGRADGYHYDVMAETEIDFGSNRIFPNNPKHAFAGYDDNN